MFQQRHNNITSSELDQMLHMLSSSSSNPMPFSTTSMDQSNSKWKPHVEIAPNCPRCASTNTKFCYYNNYSLSQPRYFCKGCRRYWTKGGSLRNVPVGGGCRKHRRGKVVRNSYTNHLSADDGSVDDNQQNQNNGSRDIDMAVVFAKFLNQNISSHHGGHEELEAESEANNNIGTSSSNNMTPDSIETENDAVVQPQSSFDTNAVVVNRDPFDQELSLSEFEGFLGVDEDVVQDVLWDDSSDAMMVSTWQQQPPPSMMQMELDSMPLPLNGDNHDQLLLPVTVNSNSASVNLINESWNTCWDSFDLSTMEVFSSRSRP